jgi:SAM-dependent methyltransferase
MADIPIVTKEELLRRFTGPTNQELEIRFFNIDYPGFHNTIHYLKNQHDWSQSTSQSLNIDFLERNERGHIMYNPEDGRIRIELIGREKFRQYCKNNQLPNTFKLTYKKLIGNVPGDIKYTLNKEITFDYNKGGDRPPIPSSITGEDHREFDGKLTNIISKIGNWSRERKTFRLISRVSFTKGAFRVDLSRVQSEAGKTIVIRRGVDKKNIRQDYKSFSDAKVLESIPKYEIEIELIHPTTMDELTQLIEKITPHIRSVPYALSKQDNDNLFDIYRKFIHRDIQTRGGAENIYRQERNLPFTRDHKLLRKDKYFIGPKPISIEKKHITPLYEYSINSNIREKIPGKNKTQKLIKYTVTDKADGRGSLMYIVGLDHLSASDRGDYARYLGRIILIDNNLKIYNTGLTDEREAYHNSLFNGEYITKNADEKPKPIKLFKMYDCYIVGGVNKMELILMDGKEGEPAPVAAGAATDEAPQTETRYRHMLEYGQREGENGFKIESKTFYLPNEKSGISIYNVSQRIWNSPRPYHYDGLIYTPADKPVNWDPRPEKSDFLKSTSTTWFHNYKWKPPEENTIDCFIQFQRTVKIINKKRIYKLKTRQIQEDSVVATYIEAKLYVMNRNLPVQFKNTLNDKIVNPILLKLNDRNKHICRDLSILKDNTVVECAYTLDKADNPNKKWSILRTRYDKTSRLNRGLRDKYQYLDIIKDAVYQINRDGDARDQYQTFIRQDKTFKFILQNVPGIPEFGSGANKYQIFKDNVKKIKKHYLIKGLGIDPVHKISNLKSNYGNNVKVAQNIWRTIHTPITTDMITRGIDIPLEYYGIVDPKHKDAVRPMIDFHNKHIKEYLYKEAVKLVNSQSKQVSLLEIASGQGGDLHRWVKSEITSVLGIDLASSGVEESETRYEEKKATLRYRNLRNGENYNYQFTRGDASQLFSTQPTTQDKLAQDEFRRGFDIVSIQFAIHYMFEDEASLNNLIQNIDDNLKPGGYLIGTTFDGASVLEQLRVSNPLEGKNEEETLWKIEMEGDIPSIERVEYGSKIKTTLPWIHNELMEESLVNFEVLKTKLEANNIRKINSETFGDYYREHEGDRSGSRPPVLKPYEELYSFMNRYFIFRKDSPTARGRARASGGVDERKSPE